MLCCHHAAIEHQAIWWQALTPFNKTQNQMA
jgi:hypothetical protein